MSDDSSSSDEKLKTVVKCTRTCKWQFKNVEGLLKVQELKAIKFEGGYKMMRTEYYKMVKKMEQME